MKAKGANLQKAVFLKLCREFNLPQPIPECQFAKDIGRKWRADYMFVTDEKKVALEVEGGVYTRGRHTRGSGFAGDMEKYNEMARRGILLLRVQPKDLNTTKTLKMIRETISNNK